MATTAESARRWLDEKQPDTAELNQVIGKLQARIDAWPEDEERVQGSIEALDLLESVVAAQTSGQASAPPELALDTSPLVDHAAEVRERPPAEKRALFEQLKQSFGQGPMKGGENAES